MRFNLFGRGREGQPNEEAVNQVIPSEDLETAEKLPFEDLVDPDDLIAYREFTKHYPDKAKEVVVLVNPDLSPEEFFKLTGEFNDRANQEQSRELNDRYGSVRFEINELGRSLVVKYFENGRVSVSATVGEGENILPELRKPVSPNYFDLR